MLLSCLSGTKLSKCSSLLAEGVCKASPPISSRRYPRGISAISPQHSPNNFHCCHPVIPCSTSLILRGLKKFMSEEYHLLPAARVVPRSQVIAIIRAYSSVADRFLGNLEVNRNVQLLGEVLSLQSESLPDLGTSRCAVLTFGCLPRLNDGFVLGSDPKTCDITIGPDGKDVSARHLVVGFDNNEQVIMKDISSCGTHVSYSKRRDEYFRRAYTEEQGPFVWVLPPGWPVRVRIGKVLLEILVPDHSPYMEQYRHSVQGFRSDCRNRSPPIDSISIQRDVRETGSEKTPADGQTPRGTWTADDGSTTPRQGIQSSGMGAEGAVRSRPTPAEGNENEGLSDAVYIQDEESPALGSGSNGIVRKYYDASTWLLYAGKELKHGELDEEVILMENHPHVSRPPHPLDRHNLAVLSRPSLSPAPATDSVD